MIEANLNANGLTSRLANAGRHAANDVNLVDENNTNAGTPMPDTMDASPKLRFVLLAMIGAIYFPTYDLANWLAAQRASVPMFAFGWEQNIPFIPWTIIPYWSIDFLYACAFLFRMSRNELFTHVKQLLLVQLVSVACFIAWPLHARIDRPAISGVPGVLFTLLGSLDKPYNQAPSLHISLLVVLWVFYARHWRNTAVRAALHLWFALIGISVLTTYQHHVVDVPTGIAVGCLALFVFPLRNTAQAPQHGNMANIMPDGKSRRLLFYYAFAAFVMAIITRILIPRHVGLALLTGWIALALACMAWIYRKGTSDMFQKNGQGQFPLPVLLLLMPTIISAFINSRIRTLRRQKFLQIDERLFIGRTPVTRELRKGNFTALLDLTAEMPRWATLTKTCAYVAIPQLDLVAPSCQQLHETVSALKPLHDDGRNVLVCGALGYERSVLCAAAWLAYQRGLRDAHEALAAVRIAQPYAVWSDAGTAVLQEWIDRQSVDHATVQKTT